MKKPVVVISLITLCLFCISCENRPNALLPSSGGRPYEVMVVGDAIHIVRQALEEDVENLPQDEPCFDVSESKEAGFNRFTRLARNIVVVNVNGQLTGSTRVHYEKNVYAHPQMIVYIDTPDMPALKEDIQQIAPTVRRLLTRFEINQEIKQLKCGPVCKTVWQMFAWQIKLPADMRNTKKGKNFVWIADNAAGGTRNVCLYTLPLHCKNFKQARDSVMQRNIPGERPGSYMQTVTTHITAEKEKGKTITVARGLWQMKNDAMGGPYVAHIVKDEKKRCLMVAEGFVYSPETTKRNKIRQLEAVLYTLTEYNKNQKER